MNMNEKGFSMTKAHIELVGKSELMYGRGTFNWI